MYGSFSFLYIDFFSQITLELKNVFSFVLSFGVCFLFVSCLL